MSAVDEYLDRLDQMASEQGGVPSEATNESIQENGAMMRPYIERLAERAGVELVDIVEAIAARIAIPVGITQARIDAGHDLDAELSQLAIGVGLQMFLSGAGWDQWRKAPAWMRELPDVS